MTKQEFMDSIAKYARKYAPQYGICIISPAILVLSAAQSGQENL